MPGVYVYIKTGGGSLKFWQINASGTVSFQITLTAGPGGNPAGDVGVYRVNSDGTKGELLLDTNVSLNNPATIQFDIPDGEHGGRCNLDSHGLTMSGKQAAVMSGVSTRDGIIR